MSKQIPQRQNVKKKQRMNSILNISIGLVALLIVVVSVSLFTGGSDEAAEQDGASQEVADSADNGDINLNGGENENSNENESINIDLNNEENENNEAENNASNETNTNENNANDSNENNANNDNNDANENNSNDRGGNEADLTENDDAYNTDQNGDWGPIGTVQEEPFEPVFDRSHVNWDEMVRAIVYAADLPNDEDDLIIWRLENGGSPQTAVGTVSERGTDYSNPYQVELEWVENEGWMPVGVDRLSSNPYN
ncbi:YrrS family protein [Alkalicoccus luteus]|uniref:YrrS family protein n=1 Tax=Alkalicoccus luteus TaxID=1237094 RepID=UPI0040348D99